MPTASLEDIVPPTSGGVANLSDIASVAPLPPLPKPPLPEGLTDQPPPITKVPGYLRKAWDFMNTNAIQQAGGATFTDVYDAAGEGLKKVSEKVLGEPYSTTRERLPFLKGAEFVGNVGKVIPGMADSLLTPLGAATGAVFQGGPIAKAAGAWLPHTKAAVGGAFATNIASEIPEAVREAKKDPNPNTLSNVVVKSALTALPFVAAKTKPVSKESLLAAKTKAIDKYAPIEAMEKEGGGVPIDASPYVGARNFAGRAGTVQANLNELADILPKRHNIEFGKSPYGINPNRVPSPDLDFMRQYGLLERHEELFKRLPGYKTPEGDTLPGVMQKRSALEQTMGPQKTTEVRNRLERLYKFQDRILDEAHHAGIVGDDSFNAIKAQGRNEKYLPLQRIAYLADELDQNVPVGSNAFNVPAQNLIRTIQGSEGEILDPFQGIIRNIAKATSLIERNKVARKMGALSSDPRFAGVVEPLRINGDPGPGRDFFSVLVDGKKQQYSVPKGVGEAMKNMNAENVDLVTRWASKSAGALRAGATSLYLPFIPANALRDFQTATVASPVGFTPLDWLKGFAEAVSPGKDFDRYQRSGGSFSGFFHGQKALPSTLDKLTEDSVTSAIKTVVNPIELMRLVGEKIELAPRLGVFKRSLAQGNSDFAAGYHSRNATVDFSKSGTVMRVANMWVPFLNARLQGNLNFYSAIKDKPGESALKLTALVGLPAVALHVWNNQPKFQKVTKDIAEFEKDANFVMVYGDEKDENGRYTQVVKMPKGEVQPFASNLENYLNWMSKNDTKSYRKLAIETLSGLSPIPFESQGEISPMRAASSLLPPLVKAGLEGGTNQNFYTGRPIVPQSIESTGAAKENQYPASTPAPFVKAAKGIAGAGVHVSPMALQNAMTAQFGGVGRMLAQPDKASGALTNRFKGAFGGAQQEKDFETLRNVGQGVGNEKMDKLRTVQSTLARMKAAPPEQRQAILQAALPPDPQEQTAFLKQFDTLFQKNAAAIAHESFERAVKSKPVEVRAKMLIEKLKTLQGDERAQFFQDWMDKKIITQGVIDQMDRALSTTAQ